MVSTIKEAKDLAKKWNDINEDIDRLKFLKDNNTKMKVILDNDQTQVGFIHDMDTDEETEVLNDLESELNSFDNFCGDDDLVYTMFEFIGIEAEGC